MTGLWIAFLGGAAAFGHCLGMCGGFALHLSTGPGAIRRQLLWHAGRICTYAFLGSLAGFLGARAAAWPIAPWLPKVLSYLAGGVLIFGGLSLAGLWPWRKNAPDGPGLLSGLIGPLLGQPSAGVPFVLGLVCGFLPCPVVWGFLALALAGASVLNGLALLTAMGLGTVGALLLLGVAGKTILVKFRRFAPAIASAVLLVLGAVTILRGTDAFHAAIGCAECGQAGPAQSTSTQPASAPACPNCGSPAGGR